MQQIPIYFKSDFKLFIRTEAGFAVPFRFEFYTNMPSRPYIAKFDGHKYHNCELLEDGRLCIAFDDHGFGLGKLMIRQSYYLNDADYASEICDRVIAPQPVVNIDDNLLRSEIVLALSGDDTIEFTSQLPPYYQAGLTPEEHQALIDATTHAEEASTSANTAATNANEKATLAEQKASDAQTAASTANTAATNANSKATLAEQKASDAQTAASTANAAAENANSKATLAEQKADDAQSAASTANAAATNANEKATLAEQKADDAQSAASAANAAATNANTKATLAEQKATLAQNAATNANEKAQAANTAATNATTQANYAKEQGDYAAGFNNEVKKLQNEIDEKANLSGFHGAMITGGAISLVPEKADDAMPAYTENLPAARMVGDAGALTDQAFAQGVYPHYPHVPDDAKGKRSSLSIERVEGECLGVNQCYTVTNFQDGTTNWKPSGTIETTLNGDVLRCKNGSTWAGIAPKQDTPLVVGNKYVALVTMKSISGDTNCMIGGTAYGRVDVNITEHMTGHGGVFTALKAEGNVLIRVQDATAEYEIKNATLLDLTTLFPTPSGQAFVSKLTNNESSALAVCNKLGYASVITYADE